MLNKLLFFCLFLLSITISGFGQEEMEVNSNSKLLKALVFPIRDVIDPRMTRMTRLAIEEAKVKDVDFLVIDMNTYGGMVADADSISMMLLKFEKPTMVFINNNAGSAGSMISISCDSIYMAPASIIGASTVVDQQGAVVAEKYQAFMRSKMRTIAKENDRDPAIAEGMVGTNLQSDSAKVISFTTDEAIAANYCEGKVLNIGDIFKKYGYTNVQLERFELSGSEKIIASFLNPWLKGILLLVIIGGIYFELQTPGVGFPIIASVTAAALYFIPDYLNGFLANWELILFVLGIALLALEVFVIPGFGIAGVSGLSLMVIGLALSIIPNDGIDFSDVPVYQINQAIIIACVGVVGFVTVLFVGGAALAKSNRFRKLTVQTEMASDKGYSVRLRDSKYIGKSGESYTVLRPSGKVIIEGEVCDASTRGEWVDKGTEVVVLSQDGEILLVKEKS